MKHIVGLFSFLSLAINMLIWCSVLLILGVIRLAIPLNAWRKIITRITVIIGESCIYCNGLWIRFLLRPKWSVEGLENLDIRKWYLATSNHQSWGDIFVLQFITNKRMPLLRFFMKDVLKWIPIVSIVGWSMNMPFLKRYSKEKLKRKPELRGHDIDKMKKSFKKLSTYPSTVFSFAEGTRYSKKKHKKLNSNFRGLLNPKVGGIAMSIATMPYIKTLVDFTIKYSSNNRSFWDFLCGRMSEASIKVRVQDIPKEFYERDFSLEKEYREDLKEWLFEIWGKKEAFMRKEDFIN